MYTKQLLTKSDYQNFLSEFDTFLFDCDGIFLIFNLILPNSRCFMERHKTIAKRSRNIKFYKIKRLNNINSNKNI